MKGNGERKDKEGADVVVVEKGRGNMTSIMSVVDRYRPK
jgi:hypothetical protein